MSGAYGFGGWARIALRGSIVGALVFGWALPPFTGGMLARFRR